MSQVEGKGGVSKDDADKTKKKTNVSRSKGIFKILKDLITPKKLTAEEKATLAICNRQRELERNEIKEDWRVVFGDQPPKKKKDIFIVKNVTLRKLWMEPLFLYETITNLHTEANKASMGEMECYHPAEKYYLQWLPPGYSDYSAFPCRLHHCPHLSRRYLDHRQRVQNFYSFSR